MTIGTMVYSDNAQCESCDGKRHGQRTCRYDAYVREWIFGKRHGEGVQCQGTVSSACTATLSDAYEKEQMYDKRHGLEDRIEYRIQCKGTASYA